MGVDCRNVSAACALSIMASTASLGGNMTLVEDGAARVSIEIAIEARHAAVLAARELQYFIEQITGTRLPVVSRPGLGGVRIRLNDTEPDPDMDSLTAEQLELRPYEHFIGFTPSTIFLLGHDAEGSTGKEVDYTDATGGDGDVETILLPGMFDNQGTLRAAYDFLERFCEVRFYGPKAISVDIPRHKTLTISGKNIRREPSIPHISGSFAWRFPLVNGLFGNPSDDALLLFERRMRLGGIPWYTNHTLHKYPERFPRDRFPQFYAEEGGGELCYSSKALVRQVAQDARDYFDGKDVPHLTLPKGTIYFPVVPRDAARFCQCENCRLLLEPYVNDVPRTPSGTPVFNDGRSSHLWFTFINRVARELKKTHPGMYISTLAYESYFWHPAAFELDPNVAIGVCLQVRNYWHRATRDNEERQYPRWVSDGRPLFLWNYLCFPEEPAAIHNWHCFPGFYAHTLAKLTKRYARDGVLGTFFCGIGEQVDLYVTAKLYDDASRDVNEILDEFFNRYFGAAAKPMQKFYDLIEETYSNPDLRDQNGYFHQTEQTAWEQLGTEPVMSKLKTFIEQAEQLASSDIEKERVALWKTGVWDYMVEGRQAYLRKKKQQKHSP